MEQTANATYRAGDVIRVKVRYTVEDIVDVEVDEDLVRNEADALEKAQSDVECPGMGGIYDDRVVEFISASVVD